MKSSVLVVEDEKSIADTILYRLNMDGFATTWVTTGVDALAHMAKESMDIIVLDIGLPDINGLDLCRTIRKNSEIPIIFLTALNDEIDRIVGLELGGDDYLTKPFSPRELSARVRAILRRSPQINVENNQIVNSMIMIDESSKSVFVLGTKIELAKQEFRILSTLLGSPRRVFSREELMNIAWDDPGYCSDRAVDAHIKAIRAKIRLVSVRECILTHRGFGYSFEEPTI